MDSLEPSQLRIFFTSGNIVAKFTFTLSFLIAVPDEMNCLLNTLPSASAHADALLEI